ncbi:MAG: Na(+)/H(+) antiporter subunit B, partial [Salinisphaera sp.]|nr:Na(+)/H(+) antiporter subunit B [Salinisphaera sp.]
PVEIGVPNVVSAVLASYRGYDTLGETTVIFTAAIAVLMLLGTRRRKAMRPVNDNSILRVVAQLLAPVILLFALYVQFHGDYGPGGGFQAGVLFAAAILLFGLVCGLDAAHAIMRPNLIRIMAAAGVLVYGGTGVATMLLGGQYLDYDVLAHDSVHGQHLGIMLVEFGVGLTVTATMVGLFAVFAARGSWRG